MDSAVAQTLKELEIICVNDASSDDSREILEQYKQKYNMIRVINHLENKSTNHSTNFLNIISPKKFKFNINSSIQQ